MPLPALGASTPRFRAVGIVRDYTVYGVKMGL